MDAAKETVLVFLATCLLKQRDAEKNNIKCVPEPHSNIKHTLQARCNSMWKPTLNTHLMKLCGQGGTPSQSSPRRLSQKWTISFMKMQNFGNEMTGHNFEEILRVRGEAGRMEDQGRFNILFWRTSAAESKKWRWQGSSKVVQNMANTWKIQYKTRRWCFLILPKTCNSSMKTS